MRSIACMTLVALVLVSATAPTLTSAASTSAHGNYRFVLEDELTKTVSFSASLDESGAPTGQMTFTDEALISEVDPESGDGDEPHPLSFTATLDGLTVEGNR